MSALWHNNKVDGSRFNALLEWATFDQMYSVKGIYETNYRQ